MQTDTVEKRALILVPIVGGLVALGYALAIKAFAFLALTGFLGGGGLDSIGEAFIKGYLILISCFLVAPIVGGAILKYLRIPHALAIAFCVVASGQLVSGVYALLNGPMAGEDIVTFVGGAIGALLVYKLLKPMGSKVAVVVIVIGVNLFGLFGGSMLAQNAATHRVEENAKVQNFDAFKPTYLPAGYEFRGGHVEEYAGGTVTGIGISFVRLDIGSIAIYESEPITHESSGQSFIDYPNRCDIYGLSRAFRSKVDVGTSSRPVGDSADLPKCQEVAVTKNNRKIFTESPPNTQTSSTQFYTKIDNTVLVIDFYGTNDKAYTPKLLSEVIKMVESMQKFDPASLR